MTNRNTVQRTATLDVEWQDLTPAHRKRRNTIEDQIAKFPNEHVQATYVVGAIGAGKSILLRHAFRYAWTEAKKPAIFAHLSEIIEGLSQKAEQEGRETIPQTKLHRYLEEICLDRLKSVKSKLESGERLSAEDYLPDARNRPKPEEYFEQINVHLDDAKSTANKENELILLIDEMEEGYQRLSDLVEGTTGPLRDVVDVIDKGNSSFYMIGAFGYASAHELGEAEARRVRNVNLPIIRPRQVGQILETDLEASEENFAWWMSRGRPGWLAASLDSKDDLIDDIDARYDQLDEIATQSISRVDMLDTDGLEEHFSQLSRETRNFVSYLLTEPQPIEVSEFEKPPSIRKLIEVEASEVILCSNSLTDVDEVYDSFEKGVNGLSFYNSDVSERDLRQFGTRVLQGIADENNNLVLGHVVSSPPVQPERAYSLVMQPLAERMHDIALEELGDNDQETVDFLYQLSKEMEEKDVQDAYGNFEDFFDLFSEDGDLTDDTQLSVSLQTLLRAFPSFITNPRLGFAGRESSESGQYESLIDTLENIQGSKDKLSEFGEIIQEDPR